MKKKILIDTDVVIDFLKGVNKAVKYIKSHSDEIVLSVITVSELYAGVKDDERQELDEFIGLFPVFPVTTEIAKKGGLHKRDYFKSHSVGLADGIIAATTETHDVDLKTLNTKHYPMLKGLKRPYFK